MLIPMLTRVPIFILSFIITFLIYTLLSAGWNIIGGYMNYFSFGHGAFFGIGAYLTAVLMRDYGATPLITLPFTAIVTMVIALGVGYPSLRLKGVYFCFTTVSLSYIFMIIFSLIPWAGPLGILLPLHPFEPYVTELIPYEMLLIVFLATTLIVIWISQSKFGLALKSIRCDEEGAEVRGVNVTKFKILAFMISAVPPALAGGIYAYYTLYIDPETVFSMEISMYAAATVLLGGGGTILGPIIGSIIYTFIFEFFRYRVTWVSGFHQVISGAIIIGVLFFMPGGIIGKLRKKFPHLRIP